jgi:hypothetical protein
MASRPIILAPAGAPFAADEDGCLVRDALEYVPQAMPEAQDLVGHDGFTFSARLPDPKRFAHSWISFAGGEASVPRLAIALSRSLLLGSAHPLQPARGLVEPAPQPSPHARA